MTSNGYKLVVNSTSQCAINEINYLCGYPDNPADALRDFWRADRGAPIILFSGVVKSDSPTDNWSQGCQYAQLFHQLIVDEKLGEVVVGPEKENRRHHPGHIIRAYLWTPDRDAIKAFLIKKFGVAAITSGGGW